MSICESRWTQLCHQLEIKADLDEFKRLHKAYSEPQRAYHTLQHLSECLEQLDWFSTQNTEPKNIALAEIALWYHDAIYQPQAHDNELQSANWAVRFLSQAGLNYQDCQLIQTMIMATCHRGQPQQFLSGLVVDVDLSILGAESQRFAEYEQQIRQEYQWVPWSLYKSKRKEVLENFLAHPRIYNTELFYLHYETKARQNLQQAIAKICKISPNADYGR